MTCLWYYTVVFILSTNNCFNLLTDNLQIQSHLNWVIKLCSLYEKNVYFFMKDILSALYNTEHQIHFNFWSKLFLSWASLVAQMVKKLLQCGRSGFDTWVDKIPWRRVWQPTPVFLPGESPWTEESGGLQTVGLQRVGHEWVTKYSTECRSWTYISK